MKKFSTVIAVLIIAAFFVGCEKEDDHGQSAKHVYTMNNQVAGNKVIVFEKLSDGSLHKKDSFATGGKGTGNGLGSQGALTLSRNQNWLFAVNAGSNEISVFLVKNNQLQLTSNVASGGKMPISITNYQNWVYVLNAGGNGSIAGFYVTPEGDLTAIPGSFRELNDKVTAPAQIAFSDDGASLIITEKAANKIVSYNVTASGIPGKRHELSSASATPFGFAVGKNGYVFVSEAMQSALSVYRVTDAAITLTSGPVPDKQNAACWVALTENGKYAYVANAASNSISGYSVSPSYEITLLNSDGVTAAAGNAPIDEALSSNSKFLYVLNSGSHTIRAFAIKSDGSLNFLADGEGLPIGAGGLAAD